MAQPTTIKSGLKIEDVSPAAPQKYSTFDELSYRFSQTQRFGEITPHCAFATMKAAKDSFRCMNDTSTYTLKAPLKTDMFQKRSNFFVPLQAILYNNWELVVAQPNQGDDVSDDVNGVVTGTQIRSLLSVLISNINVRVSTASYENVPDNIIGEYLTSLLRSLLITEAFCSQGSLIKQLCYDFSHLIVAYESMTDDGFLMPRSFDVFLEQVLGAIAPRSFSDTGIHYFTVTWYNEDEEETDEYLVCSDQLLWDNPRSQTGLLQRISFRHFLDLARQNLNFIISDVDISDTFSVGYLDPGESDEFGPNKAFLEFLFGKFNNLGPMLQVADADDFPEKVNWNRLSAYQIICAHFFSCDHVDYIYSAQLYRQLMGYYLKQLNLSTSFSWNGIALEYDYLSGNNIRKVFSALSSASLSLDDIANETFNFLYDHSFSYFTALFSFRHSLRYMDYFTGGRTRPLSVGDVGVAVSGGEVNAVDMIMRQNAARFLNFAQRVGRKISNWLQQIAPGGQPRPDMHDPQWLSSTGDALTPEQTQNTAEAQVTQQNSITANLKNNSNRYQFTIQPDRPGYVICVTYYDIPRSYAFATDRENFHADRYDMFNPFFQYNGSQAVTKSEIGLDGNTPFSYQNKYSEYKQKYDIVAGGCVEFLPGWFFVADLQSGLPMQDHLSPSYIRSWNCELDPFFTRLTGYGLAAYFHFIVKNVNIIKGVRPMEYAPQLM